jgi:hypothetical protein
MIMNDYVVFIISHGRPDNVLTLKTLKRCGYSGDYRIVVDNEDKTRADYEKKYGDKVVVFDKLAYANMVDESNNFNDRRTTTHVRNACFDIAADCGFVKFLVLDDDYTAFQWRTDSNQNYLESTPEIKNVDVVFRLMFDFLEKSGLDCVAMAQGGDFLGGKKAVANKSVAGIARRKIMNSFFCMTTRRFWFISQMNEDVNTYLQRGRTGAKFMTVPFVSVGQKQTQSGASGMTDVYLRYGTYVKSFYSVMYAPSCTRVRMMGQFHRRIHHSIKWKNAVPQILPSKLKK